MANFNPYKKKIDIDFWRELCQREGKLRHYNVGEPFLMSGNVGVIVMLKMAHSNIWRQTRRVPNISSTWNS